MLSISWSKITWVTGFLRRNVIGNWRFEKLCESHLHSQVITFSQLKIGKPWGAIWLVLPHRLSKRQLPTASSLPENLFQIVLAPDLFQSRYVTPGACFSKVPKLFGRISGDIILFVSSKRRRLEARNFVIIFIFIPFTTFEKISFTE